MKCKRCKEDREASEFREYNNGKKLGRRKTCKHCQNGDINTRYASDPKMREKRAMESRIANATRSPEDTSTKNVRNAAFMANHRTPESTKRKHLKANYGITLEEFNIMLSVQNGGCFICGGVNANGRALHVDHDHATGRVRKLLCATCNTALGHCKENPNTLRAMLSYVENECVN